jgi:hypothetical protein
MKNKVLKQAQATKTALALIAVLPALLFLGGCDLLFTKVESAAGGMGQLVVSLAEPEAPPGASSRTMLALNPEFSRYELLVSPNPDTLSDTASSKSYFSDTGSFQINLPLASYALSATGYTGDKPSAKTWDSEARAVKTKTVVIQAGTPTTDSLTLEPYMDDEISGALRYSLNWDTLGQMPLRAELLIEQYDQASDGWQAIPISLITGDATAGATRGTVLLLQRATGLVQQTGSLDLPPGEYRLTTTVAMDGPWPPVSRSDIAHVYSNLTTPAAFFYGAGDLIVTPAGDSPAGFITRFNFAETPGATSIVGSSPGPDGTRLIMVMVPAGTNLTQLTPVVECVEGAHVSSPPPLPDLVDGKSVWASGDYSRPTSWTAEGRNGVTQQYTVVVTEQPSGECFITAIAFDDVSLVTTPVIDHLNRSITVTVPNGALADNPNYQLEPVISFVGDTAIGVKIVDPDNLDNPAADLPFTQGAPLEFMEDGTPARIFRVTGENGDTKTYTVIIVEALSGEAEITRFVFDGYPDRPGTIDQATGDISVTLPYGTPLGSLKPLIAYKGRLSPASGVEQNFSAPKGIVYTVISLDDLATKTYPVTVVTEGADKDTGIFDFVITNVPKAKVVVGAKPRSDGKIPIIVSVPYSTAPLIDPTPSDGPRTDLKKLIARITLSNKTDSKFVDPNTGAEITAGVSEGVLTREIPFNNQDDYQEAVYRVKAQAGNYQDYVVVAVRDVQYYYVKATGDDTDPDQYNGGSESTPFKTLAWAVYQSVKHNVDHIFDIGTLNNASEGGAWEDTATTAAGSQGAFQASGAPSTGGGNSVFNLKGAGLDDNAAARRLYITGVGSNAVLEGTTGKRVISVTGGARVTFDNITIRNGGGEAVYAGNGGGFYVGDHSMVVWKSGTISNNTAKAGGGLYLDDDADGNPDNDSSFEFLTGSISNNKATGTTITGFTGNNPSPDIDGGGGVYIKGDALFWQAEGDITGNTAAGSGGGVLVNGSVIPNRPTTATMPLNFIMSGGSLNDNSSNAGVWPGGGGGVYIAKGAFNMLGGEIMHNTAIRQGGGVFVWSRALFYMDGNSSVTANTGVGSSKAICSRGITTLSGNAQADAVYVWNYSKGSWNNGSGDEFTLMGGARITGMVLAFADEPQDGRNYINVLSSNGQFFTGSDTVTTIGLESRLVNGSFSKTATIQKDWIDIPNTYILKNGGNPVPADQAKRFILGTFTYGGASQSLSLYTLDGTGKLKRK